MGSTVDNLSLHSMNWKRLLSSVLAFTILCICCVIDANAGNQIKQAPDSIIIEFIHHLPAHSPNFYKSYSGITYQKIQIRSEFNSDTKQTNENGNAVNQKINILLFSTETLTHLKMLKPAYYQPENLSVKTEGKENELFKKLCLQLKTVSMTDTAINLLNYKYLTPFSKTSADKYNYSISDSIMPSGDILYWIHFEPKPGKKFFGFKGKALVNPKNYTFQKIIAVSAQNVGNKPNFEMEQNFEQIKGPTLTSEIRIKAFFSKVDTNYNKFKTKISPGNLIVENISTFYQQEINPPLKAKDFETTVLPNDSAIIVFLQNKQRKMIRMMSEGKLPFGKFDLNYDRIFGYNLYEGIKLGLGMESNRNLSNYFTVGGYFSYGLKDQSIRHGEWVNIYPSGQSGFRIHLGYKDRSVEYGEPEFLENLSLLNPENFRNLLVSNMYSTKRFTTGIEYRASKELNFFLFSDQSENKAPSNSPFLLAHPFSPISLTRTGLQINYSPGRKFQTDDGQPKETATPTSDFHLTMIQGLTILNNQFQYTKIEFKGKFDFPLSNLGTTTILLRGGLMTNDAPMIEHFNGYGSYVGNFSLAAPWSFATMQLNEFASTRFAAVHVRHDFSAWMFPENNKTKPALIFAQNIGFGWLDDKYKNQFHFRDYCKGFYESGIELNNLLRIGAISWGAGIYYRYGPYRLNPIHENFAYKFGFMIKI